MNGVEDLHEFGERALDHWMDLHDLVQSMQEKYYRDESGSTGDPGKNDHRHHKGNHNKRHKSHHKDYAAESVSSLFA